MIKEVLDDHVTISRAVHDWCDEHGIARPGKVAVASRLMHDPGQLRLTPEGTDALRALHGVLSSILGAL